MKNQPTIAIWESCAPTVADAIQHFEDRWQPYSVSSRRYPIIRLIEEVIDPAVTAVLAHEAASDARAAGWPEKKAEYAYFA